MANISVQVFGHEKKFDVINVALLFWPGSRIIENKSRLSDVGIISRIKKYGDKEIVYTSVRFAGKRIVCTRTIKNGEDLRFIKLTLFIACKKATAVCPPWGILTGIRPMSVYEKLYALHNDHTGAILERDFLVSRQKRSTLDLIYSFRKDVYYAGVKEDVSLYVSIPFCPSKCSYCSFVSASIERVQHLVEPYLRILMKEIEEKIKLIYHFHKRISTVYIGGGTPGILTSEQIDQLLNLIFSKLKDPLYEFCFEIGRPETITPEKLAILKKYPVNRLCINCQTLDDSVLTSIGRRHTSKQFLEACRLAEDYGFKSINVDLIAGLPGETLEGHIESLKKVLSLGVTNVTVHTLSIKKASTWECENDLYDPKADRVAAMLECGSKILSDFGYKPYYIYRQKNTLSNGENVGYSVDGHVCRYNIYMMEDVHSVFGCGAGASTKIMHNSNGRIDRFVNTKYPQEYLKFPEKLEEQIRQIYENMEGTC